MARLPRKHLKVFASAASNNGQFGSAQLGTKVITSDIETIQALAAWENGWNDATVTAKRFPTLEETQSLDYVKTYMLAYMFQEGIPEWNADTPYYLNSIVKKAGTYQLYGSKIDDNVGHALPVAASDANWQYLQDISAPPVVSPASETVTGIAELATQAETNAGTDDLRIVTPLKLAGRTASESMTGIAEIATQAETNTGTDDARFITPLKLATRTATETMAGITENATLAEALAGIDDFRYISPAKLAYVLSFLSQVPTGTIQDFAGASAPTGYLLCFGQLVNRVTYGPLFAVIGTAFGAGDGVTTFGLPDLRGRVGAGKDNMGGTPAGRLTGQAQGVNGIALGAAGGEETHVLTTTEMPAHTHKIDVYDTDFPDINAAGGTGSTTAKATTDSTGDGVAHNNVQPTIILNKIIKT